MSQPPVFRRVGGFCGQIVYQDARLREHLSHQLKQLCPDLPDETDLEKRLRAAQHARLADEQAWLKEERERTRGVPAAEAERRLRQLYYSGAIDVTEFETLLGYLIEPGGPARGAAHAGVHGSGDALSGGLVPGVARGHDDPLEAPGALYTRAARPRRDAARHE